MGRHMLVGIGVAIVVVLGSVVLLFKSDRWQEAEGKILRSEVEVIRHSTLSNIDSTRGLTRYKLNLEYQYFVKGELLEGNRLYAGLPSIFTDERDARRLEKQFSLGAKTTVYYNPAYPAESALLLARMDVKQKVIFLTLIIFIAACVGGGFFVMNKI